MISFPAVNSANSIVVDTNVIMNLLISDPTGSSLNLLILDNSTTYITDTVEAELRNNLTGQKFAVYLAWVTCPYFEGHL
jgi:predicted nucleic acid-binding protein